MQGKVNSKKDNTLTVEIADYDDSVVDCIEHNIDDILPALTIETTIENIDSHSIDLQNLYWILPSEVVYKSIAETNDLLKSTFKKNFILARLISITSNSHHKFRLYTGEEYYFERYQIFTREEVEQRKRYTIPIIDSLITSYPIDYNGWQLYNSSKLQQLFQSKFYGYIHTYAGDTDPEPTKCFFQKLGFKNRLTYENLYLNLSENIPFPYPIANDHILIEGN